MQALGIIGGIAPESTIDYYRRIIAAYRAARPTGGYPRILINSIDMSKLLSLAGAGDLAAMSAYLSQEVAVLARAGAGLALFASNTPHLVFDAVQKSADIPLLSIVEASCAATQALGLRRVGLVGTRFTMQSAFYADVFGPRGVSVVAPLPNEQDFIHSRYVGELVEGVFLPETRTQMLAVMHDMIARENLDGLVLAGTELPLLLGCSELDGIPLLDTTGVHVEAATQYLLS